MTGARTRYAEALAAFDLEQILAAMSDDVTIRVAVHDNPLQGKEVARFLFGVLLEELTPFQVTQEIVEGSDSVVLFHTTVREMPVHGLNVVERSDADLVSQLTVFFRPLPALGMIGEVIGKHMEARFGPPTAPH
jgi:SnoaL-like protein